MGNPYVEKDLKSREMRREAEREGHRSPLALLIKGDGNCLFNCISEEFYGNQNMENAINLRKKVIDCAEYEYNNNGYANRFGITVKEYIDNKYGNFINYKNYMGKNFTWATEFEFEMLASIYHFKGKLIIDGKDGIYYETLPYGRRNVILLCDDLHFYLA